MDKQMIEEMAKVIDIWEDRVCFYCEDMTSDEIRINLAEALYNAGYRKIPENAVVLTREEYEKQQKDNEDFDKFARSISDIRTKNGNKIATFNDLQDYIELQVEQARKETAEKFAERLKSMAYQSTDWSHGEHPMVVEVDYIDEICEEITEGWGINGK